MKESISSNIGDVFYAESIQRALRHSKGTRGAFKGHSKGIWPHKALGNLNT